MSIWLEMERRKNTFTAKEMEVYELVKKDPYTFSASTAVEVAEKFNVSQSYISRFCKKLGFNGFADFRLSMTLEILNPQDNDFISQEKDFVWYLTNYLQQVHVRFNTDISDKIINRIFNSNCVFTSGYGSSQFTASWLSFRLTLSKIHSINIPSSQEMEYLHVMNSSDTMMIFSYSNPSHRDFFNLYADLNKKSKPFIILISGIENHPFAKYADLIFELPSIYDLKYKYNIDPSIKQMDFAILLMYKLLSYNK